MSTFSSGGSKSTILQISLHFLSESEKGKSGLYQDVTFEKQKLT